MTGRRRINDRLLLVTNILTANAVAAIWIMAFVQPDVLGLADAGAAADGVGRRLVVPLATTAAWAALLLAVASNASWAVRLAQRLHLGQRCAS